MLDNFLYTIVIYPLVQIIEFVFVFAQKLFRVTGFSIVCVSGAISVLCLPLYIVAEGWQKREREIQKNIKPKTDKIKAVFKSDERFMMLSTLYRQNHYHPVYALRSSFGLLIQIPFFIAAYSYLSHLEMLQGAAFLFIQDLGRPDGFLQIPAGKFTVSLNVLPLMMTIINIFSAALYTKGLEIKDKIQLYGTALLFLVLLYNAPSGLVLYWTMNNVFSLAKNIYFGIPLPGKKKTITGFFSIICALLIFYTMAILRRDINIKLIMSSLFLIAGLVPWLLPLAKKYCRAFSFEHYSEKRLFSVFLFSALVIAVTAGIFIPVMLIASSPQEFSYLDSHTSPLFFVGNAALQCFGFFVFWPLCLYFLFSPGIKKIFTVTGIILVAAVLCNVFLFSGNYGLVSIDLIFDNGVGHNFRDIFINIGVLCIASVCILLVFFKGGKNIIVPLILLPLISILGVSVLNIATIQNEYKKMERFHVQSRNSIQSIEPLFHLSKKGKNTVVIMLDRATSAFVPYIIAECPGLADIYSGFVYYPNTVSFNGYTSLGAPPLFGGYEYTPLELNKRDTVTMREKHNEALFLLPRIFSEAGYEVAVTDPPYPNYSYKEDLRMYEAYPEIQAFITDGIYTEYWLKEHSMALPSQSDVLQRNLFWYGFLKIMPLALREGIYQHGGWFAPFSAHKLVSNLNAYAVLDYLPRLTDFSSQKENSFLFIVNNTTHEAAYYQAPEYRPALTVTNYGTSPYSKENEYHTNIGALKRIGEWLDFLKAEGVYDNTRLILVSDHGAQLNYVAKTNLPFNLDNVNPLLLVKNFHAEGPLKTDMAFMSNADVPFLALQNQIEPAINPFTKNPITIEAKKKPLYIALSGGVHIGDPKQTTLSLDSKINYYISDSIFDEKNWIKVDK
jgi:YidC/Oxa1 family membrane protein insertase